MLTTWMVRTTLPAKIGIRTRKPSTRAPAQGGAGEDTAVAGAGFEHSPTVAAATDTGQMLNARDVPGAPSSANRRDDRREDLARRPERSLRRARQDRAGSTQNSLPDGSV